MKLYAIISLAVFLLLGCQKVDRPGSNEDLPFSLDQLVIALKPDKNPDKMLTQRKNLATYFAKQLRRPVEVIIPLSTAVIIEGMANGTIDLAYLSSTGAVKAVDGGIGTVLFANELNGKTHYLSYWVSLKEKPYQSAAALRGQPIVFASRTSTSGFLIPVWDLYQKGLLTTETGLEGFFGPQNIAYGVGYVSALERVLAGEAEAAAVSYYVLDQDKHLSAQQRTRLKKVASQGPVPTHTLVARRTLTQQDRAALKKILQRLNHDATELRDAVFVSKLVEVGTDHLDVTREALNLVQTLIP